MTLGPGLGDCTENITGWWRPLGGPEGGGGCPDFAICRREVHPDFCQSVTGGTDISPNSNYQNN